MKPLKLIAAFLLGAAVSGCAALSPVSRNAPYDQASGGIFSFLETESDTIPAMDLRTMAVRDVVVVVPRTLAVSEDNSYYPPGDIVWRGDRLGDRHAQVEAIFSEGLRRGVSRLGGTVPAVLHVEVKRFHSLTEKTRYTVGGIHSIRFSMTLFHATTGQPLAGPKVVKANLKGYGGQRALDAERRGQTQKVRITNHLARVIKAELGRPAPELAETPDPEGSPEALAQLDAEDTAF